MQTQINQLLQSRSKEAHHATTSIPVQHEIVISPASSMDSYKQGGGWRKKKDKAVAKAGSLCDDAPPSPTIHQQAVYEAARENFKLQQLMADMQKQIVDLQAKVSIQQKEEPQRMQQHTNQMPYWGMNQLQHGGSPMTMMQAPHQFWPPIEQWRQGYGATSMMGPMNTNTKYVPSEQGRAMFNNMRLMQMGLDAGMFN